MTKKDYELIARILKLHNETHHSEYADSLASEFARELFFENPRFDKYKFYKVCGLAE